ncbi:30S ribosomal protein S3 [Candidatus Peribacteria bacterium RIFOXYC2_FULL_55_14]|uniref:30S ribosomal protein S3 n=1 Tax=uncultured organism TaxID=155900 RepID=U3GU85_9ZZZZ|nr:30S ribosomal protein S3 [uncultured organism]KKW39250.1 MAG: 30S ribosomal protein S3 [Candidatus Peribacteria bacterium GW2011_GWB1_54_5]KKW39737.1 MAG: 30S ribosomal protein S3 [Candidatus Peribacteria bacterium GW2011_GWC2_54_8]KKW43898.1 MAG: 30S ribosomal protein S3 [Candidatus Peregrinibacteria bacterium GW2011_GWA2_54_9]OGJ71739.1 MAG: 30S ribosomal protein S3 [Candidatus Peribacteria bacterium RIFOXYA1_FULL_56_14]OGJ73350.1 MAG: 30S ribosomal protein S3 [Candidatus Peribacteria bac
MGQKVNPNGMRLGITHSWPSTWFASGRKYRDLLVQDVRIREHIKKRLKEAGISSIEIERSKKTSITIHTSKPGVIIGKQGAAIEELRKDLEKAFGGSFEVNIQEIRNPDGDAEVIAETIQGQIQRRMPYRRAAKMAMEKAIQGGAKGIKILVAGRLNGADIARSELFKEGNIPLQTLRADVQFARRHAVTTFGTIGVKVWIYKGMVFKKVREAQSASLTL